MPAFSRAMPLDIFCHAPLRVMLLHTPLRRHATRFYYAASFIRDMTPHARIPTTRGAFRLMPRHAALLSRCHACQDAAMLMPTMLPHYAVELCRIRVIRHRVIDDIAPPLHADMLMPP